MSRRYASTAKKRAFRWQNILFVAFALFFIVRMVGQVIEHGELQKEIDYYQEQLATAEAAYEEQLSLQELMHNDSYIERMAREKLGMVKAGETIVSAVDINDDNTDNTFRAEGTPTDYDVDSNPE